jgi:hypothetical protein
VRRQFVLSFDIDGTLDVGDPAGPLTFRTIAQAREQGHLVGTASDRTLDDQRNLWAAAGLEPDFVLLKHDLAGIRGSLEAERYLHVGDTDRDRISASAASFEFLHVDDVVLDELPWLL